MYGLVPSNNGDHLTVWSQDFETEPFTVWSHQKLGTVLQFSLCNGVLAGLSSHEAMECCVMPIQCGSVYYKTVLYQAPWGEESPLYIHEGPHPSLNYWIFSGSSS